MKEEDIQKWVSNIIKEDRIRDFIENFESTINLNTIENPNYIPSFSLDYLLHKKAKKAASAILSSFYSLQIISEDQNISKTKSEVLRPDILAYNPEDNVLLIFELKKDTQTARQTLTELLAYEQELQNHLPFLSNADIYYVIIASEWSILLDHAVSSLLLWQNKLILGLELKTNEDSWCLMPKLDYKWHYTNYNGLPDGFVTMNISLNNKGNEAKKKITQIRQITTGCKIISSNANRLNVHGFLILWENTLEQRVSDFIITVCVINPMKYFLADSVYKGGKKNNQLVTYLIDNKDMLEDATLNSLLSISMQAQDFLQRYYDVELEGFMSWNLQKEILIRQSIPYCVNFWGELNEYAIERFIMENNHSVLDLKNNAINYSFEHPYYAIPLILDISENLLKDGAIGPEFCFKYGCLLGAMANSISIESLFQWKKYELLNYYEDIRYLLRPDVVEISFKDDKKSLESITRLIHSFIANLSGRKALSDFFLAGVEFSIFIEDLLWEHYQYADLSQINTKKFAELFDVYYLEVKENSEFIIFFMPIEEKMNITTELEEADNVLLGLENDYSINATLERINIFKNLIIPMADKLYEHIGIAKTHKDMNIDWMYVKKIAINMFENGEKYPMIFWLKNGNFGIREGHEACRLMGEIKDPESEIFLLLDDNMIFKKTWDEIIQEYSSSRQARV